MKTTTTAILLATTIIAGCDRGAQDIPPRQPQWYVNGERHPPAKYTTQAETKPPAPVLADEYPTYAQNPELFIKGARPPVDLSLSLEDAGIYFGWGTTKGALDFDSALNHSVHVEEPITQPHGTAIWKGRMAFDVGEWYSDALQDDGTYARGAWHVEFRLDYGSNHVSIHGGQNCAAARTAIADLDCETNHIFADRDGVMILNMNAYWDDQRNLAGEVTILHGGWDDDQRVFNKSEHFAGLMGTHGFVAAFHGGDRAIKELPAGSTHGEGLSGVVWASPDMEW